MRHHRIIAATLWDDHSIRVSNTPVPFRLNNPSSIDQGWDDDLAFYADGEWVRRSEIDDYIVDEDDHEDRTPGWERADEIYNQLIYKEWQGKYPNGRRSLVPHFVQIMDLAESYHSDTGLHLNLWGDIGELFAAITIGIKLHRSHAQGSDGRVGNDFVEVKTISPVKGKDIVAVKRAGHFNAVYVVKVNDRFEVSGRLIKRSKLPKGTGKYIRIPWDDLPDQT